MSLKQNLSIKSLFNYWTEKSDQNLGRKREQSEWRKPIRAYEKLLTSYSTRQNINVFPNIRLLVVFRHTDNKKSVRNIDYSKIV